MRDAYNIFLNELGPNDRNTKEAESWLEQLTQNAVSIAKHAKDIQARRLRRINLSTRVSLAARHQPQVGQPTPETVKSKTESNHNAHLDTRSIDELLKFIEGGESSSSRSKQKKHTTTNPKLRGSKQSAVKAA
jgi:protein TIF31